MLWLTPNEFSFPPRYPSRFSVDYGGGCFCRLPLLGGKGHHHLSGSVSIQLQTGVVIHKPLEVGSMVLTAEAGGPAGLTREEWDCMDPHSEDAGLGECLTLDIAEWRRFAL